MAERPDLEAIERRLIADEQMDKDLGFMPRNIARDSARALLTYCRELEAENKRLRADIDEMSFTPEPETWRSGPGWKPKT